MAVVALGLLLLPGLFGCSSDDHLGPMDGNMPGETGDPSLTELRLTEGELSPAFAPETTMYTVALPYDVQYEQVIARAKDPEAKIQVNGAEVAAGRASSSLEVGFGATMITVSVRAPGGASRSYGVVVRKTPLLHSYLKASNTGVGDIFGTSLAMSGDTLAVSAPSEDGNGKGDSGDPTNNEASGSGAVYVFRFTGQTWAQEAYLKASNSEAMDAFGSSLALSGDTLAVGAPSEDSGKKGVNQDENDNTATDSGAVYVFKRAAGRWKQEAYIKASNTDGEDFFGSSVALSGDTLAVGAPREDSREKGIDQDAADNNAKDSGAVYIFARTGTLWEQKAYIKASNTDIDDQFGKALSLSGDVLAVGSSNEDSKAPGVDGDGDDDTLEQSGAVYVFRRSGTGFRQEAYLKASNPGSTDGFGTSLAISGDTLAVGAPREDSNAKGIGGNEMNELGGNSGAVYVFRYSAARWQQEAYIKASNAGTLDGFGDAVALSEGTLLVGAPSEGSRAIGVNGDQDDNNAGFAGAAYEFRRRGGRWVQRTYIKATNTGSMFDFFGKSLAVSGSILAIGSANEDSMATGVNGDQTDNSVDFAGAVYVLN